MIPTATQWRIWMTASGSAILPLATLAIVVLMVVPVPSIVLDVGFIANIALSLAVLMIALNAARPLDFSSFPTVLLFATLLRLALNVASTRVVLVSGHEGPGAAGHVIEAFGKFLIGGDWAVGIFVFLILMIINLVVITKGAGRVSEVSARFTLDALPGNTLEHVADFAHCAFGCLRQRNAVVGIAHGSGKTADLRCHAARDCEAGSIVFCRIDALAGRQPFHCRIQAHGGFVDAVLRADRSDVGSDISHIPEFPFRWRAVRKGPAPPQSQ